MEYKFLVSAIVSTYNSEQFIRGRLDDLLLQTIGNQLEIIIINSGSQQDEDTIIRSEYLPRYANIKYVHTEERETIYKAWNRGIKIASGKYITNANTDDRLRKDALQILSNYLFTHNEAAIVYSDQHISSIPNVTFNEIKKMKVQQWNNFSYDRLLEGCLTGPQPMWRAFLHYQDNIWFNENYEIAGDYEFSCKVALRYPLYHIPQVLGIYYLSLDSSNKQFQHDDKTFLETYKIKSEYSDKFLKQLDEQKFYQIFSYYTKWINRNIFIYYFWKLLLKIINPDKRLPTREFAFWYASRIKRFIGDIADAQNICTVYLKKKNSRLLRQEIADIHEVPVIDHVISVIIPTYNRSVFLEEALESLLHQTYKKFEVIIINNGTIDVTDVVNLFVNKLSVKLFNSNVSGSVSHAKNLGIKNSIGNYIAFLDDDDWYHPVHLKTLMSEMEKGTHVIAYTDAYVESQNEKNGKFITVQKSIIYSKKFNKKLLLIKDYIFTPCIMLNKKCFDVVGLFDENMKTDEDMDLLIRMSKYYHFEHIKKVTCSVRRTNSVDTLTKNWELMYKNALYLYQKHRAMSKYNVFVLLGQFYYLNLRKKRARKYKDGSFKYNY